MRKPDSFIDRRTEFAKSVGFEQLYSYIDHFGLYAGQHTIGNKLFTYEMFKLASAVPGDIAEFGCWKGSNLLFLAKLKGLFEPHSPKRVLGFDNFAGLPEPVSQDGKFAQAMTGSYHGSEQVLREAITLFELDDLVELIVGDGRETIPQFIEQTPHCVLSFAYLDFDLYEPTRLALELIDQSISVGGVIVFDQACTQEWPGETLAMKEFLAGSAHQFEAINNTFSRQPTMALKRVA